MCNSVSDVITLTATAPLERVMLLLQTQECRDTSTVSYDGVRDCLQRLVSEQGIASLWCGNTVRISAAILGRSLTEFLNEVVLDRLIPDAKDDDKEAKMRRRVVAAFIAGLTSVAITYPLQYAAFQMSGHVGRDKPAFNSVKECLVTTVRTAGLSGLFRGLGVTMWGILVNRSTCYGNYEWVQKANPFRHSSKSWLQWTSTFGATQVVELFAVYVSYPLETVSRRLQMETLSKPPLYDSTLDSFLGTATSNPYDGLPARIFVMVGTNLVLAAFNSELMNRFDGVRRLMMKLFH